MAEPFLGTIQPFASNYAPYGWLMCQGQLLPIQQYTALFSLIGIAYGGNGTTNFALPNLQGRIPVGMGQGRGLSNYDIGQTGGVESIALSTPQMPMHTHPVAIVAKGQDIVADSPTPGGNAWAGNGNETFYTAPGGASGAMDPKALTVTTQANGGGQPHENRMPGLALNWCIAIQGIFPQRQ